MQRDRMGAIRLLVALQQMMIRSVAVYFSMVRRKPAWASRESEPPSWMTTTGARRPSRTVPPSTLRGV